MTLSNYTLTHIHTHTHTHIYIYIFIYIFIAQSARAVEYTDCTFAKGYDTLQRVSWP